MKTQLPALLVVVCSLSLLMCSRNALAQVDCDSASYSFVVYSDDYMTGLYSGFETQILRKMYALDPNIRMLFTVGDVTPTQEARIAIDYNMASLMNCGEPEFPFFPAMGNHNYDEDASMSWFVNTYATNWSAAPENSRLARQLPGLSNFRKGPVQVLTPSGLRSTWNGTIYSFDFRNAHFVVLNNFEQAGAPQPDVNYGVWDVNGPGVDNPANSQLDWLRDDLARTDKPLKFIFSHVGNVAAWYAMNGSMTPNCVQWSEHQTYDQNDPESPFHTKELAAVLSQYSGVTVFRGHDHCPSRHIVDGQNHKVFERSYYDAYRDNARPYGDASTWEGKLVPGTFWQVDDGSAYNNVGFFTLSRVDAGAQQITFETYRWDQADGPLSLWDSFTVPFPGGGSSGTDQSPPAAPQSLAATAVSSSRVDLTWDAATDDVGVVAYRVYRQGTLLDTVTSLNYADTGLTANTLYAYGIEAIDAAGNRSPQAQTSAVTLPDSQPGDTSPPGTPGNFQAVAVSSTSIQLSWSASSDDVGVAGYRLLRGGSPLTTVTSPGYVDSQLLPGTVYNYAIQAFDAADNQSAPATATATTLTDMPPADSTPPTVSVTTPSKDGATIKGRRVKLAASASDNVSVVGVQFRVDGRNVGSDDPTSPYSITWDSRTVANGNHTIDAVARDRAGNTAVSAARIVRVRN